MATSNETVADILAEARRINPHNEWADRIEAAHKRDVAELRECLKIIRDNLLSHARKSADVKYVNKGAYLPEEFVAYERWRKALEGGD